MGNPRGRRGIPRRSAQRGLTTEWSLQVRSPLPIYPRTGPSVMYPLPSRPVRLEGGRVVGFDVVVVDGDGPAAGLRGPRSSPFQHRGSAASWVPWGPPVPLKMMRDGLVGRLVLAPEDW